MTHGRGQAHDVEIGARRDGTIVGLRVRGIANVGAYPIRGAFVPMVTRFMASGTYRIPEIEFDARIVLTNTTPTGPYRGAGRPEAAALLERSIDVLANVLDLDVVERAPAQLHPARRVSVPDRDGCDVRHRRIRARARRGTRPQRLRRLARRASGAARQW